MRMDHYCPWIGGDIAIRNHHLFYHMVISILVYICVVYCISLGYCVRNIINLVNNPKPILWGELSSHAIIIVVLSYFIYSVSVLVKYHVNLLKTNTLTKEYLGSDAMNL